MTEIKPNLSFDELATPNNGIHTELRYPEPEKETKCDDTYDERTPFQKDRDRILYSKSFRRLIHKTQVSFIGEMNEHIRTRLTHTLEVAQISRSIARQLDLNEDLAEAIALGHDLGHTPFGHIGERVINDFLSGADEKIRKDFGFEKNKIKIRFKHNFQSVRILNDIETIHRGIDGLNITCPVLEGILKHTNIKIRDTNRSKEKIVYYEKISSELPYYHLDQNFSYSLEGQIVSLSDGIAQISHDLEDAIIANYDTEGIILHDLNSMLNSDKIEKINFDHHDFLIKDTSNPGKYCIDKKQFRKFISWVIGKLILYAVARIKENMNKYKKSHPFDGSWKPITEKIATEDTVFNDYFLFSSLKKLENKYILNNYIVNSMDGKAKFMLRRIIKAYLSNIRQLPDAVLENYANECTIQTIRDEINKLPIKNIRFLEPKTLKNFEKSIIKDPVFLRLLCDHIASMTDMYAINEYQKLYSGDRLGY
jgi:dGTPase